MQMRNTYCPQWYDINDLLKNYNWYFLVRCLPNYIRRIKSLGLIQYYTECKRNGMMVFVIIDSNDFCNYYRIDYTNYVTTFKNGRTTLEDDGSSG